jgi:hypothetical protein
MARPPTYESPVKLTLYVESSMRDRAQALAKIASLSTSALFSKLVSEYDATQRTLKSHVSPIKG